ncbi:MAG: hypothetical protein LQ337_002204 [Flavoplaca oasis]|nr:MAG: hypothetical protein LQ337_002204 [Flavoplaca oasis]
MSQRCPTSQYIGIARLTHYRWMINHRGYANIVQTTDPLDVVYGVIYCLLEEDEKRLDWDEGVPWAYTKEIIPIDSWSLGPSQKLDLHREPEKKELLVYIDRERVYDAIPETEYVHRINMGIHDAVERGMPLPYVDAVIRKYIPAD